MNVFTIAEVLVSTLAAVLLVPAITLAGQCLLGSLPWRHRKPPPTSTRPRIAVLIPAHNEASGIAATVANLLPQLAKGDRLMVVADNCTDDTALAATRAASTAGTDTAGTVVVLERTDTERRGKGFALAFGRSFLASDPPDVVVFIDADCRITEGSVGELAAWAMATNRPVQADYLLTTPREASGLGAVSALAILVRNRVRPRGMARLGLPCQLTGSGMALPWALTAHADQLGANIVEDLVLGLHLALAGHAPLACPEVRVLSELPTLDRDAAQQRRRWEHGQLTTMLRYAPRLVGRGLVRGRISLVALGIDLAVPPLALLMMMLVVVAGCAVGLALAGHPGPSGVLTAIGLGMVLIGVLVAWAAHARRTIPFRRLLAVPGYLLWKVPLYLAALRNREKSWKRTQRDADVGR